MIPPKFVFSTFALLCLLPLAVPTWADDADPQPFYVGTYTSGDSKGIYLSTLNPKDGRLSAPILAGELENPSFLAINGDHSRLYAVGEVSNFKDQASGGVSAFAIQEDGTLKLLNQQASGGRGPCHVILGPDEKTVLVANYGGGSFTSLPLAEDGTLKPAATVMQQTGSSIDKSRQQGPHAHGMYLVPGTKLALGVDLGVDKVMIYDVTDERELKTHDPAFVSITPGSGPRHLATNADGDKLYVLNEMASTVDVFSFDPQTGNSEHLQKLSTLPEDFDGSNTTAEIFVHPSGKWLYCSNRGHDSIATFAIDAETGKLTALGHTSSQGKTPRSFQIAPGGKYLLVANQNTSNIASYEIDQESGTLKATGHQIEVPNPCCIDFRFD
ncbi:lactonase family protein [Blastopirellula marina]|uniref:6-phosphogluconolactonase n=1 Tax=Blastopirellula marina TaxID=124 RepID=A0A2S8GPR1_9BACT|nr:lactonase family protein [Blastopirellula marina]PQO46410.1 6-phosphogluconolactonase [Blastopirellula marina]